MQKDYIEVNRQAYDQLSDDYRKRALSRSEFESSPDEIIHHILQYAVKKQDLQVLEIGPGSGEVLKCFENRKCGTTAIDISKNIIDIAISKSPMTRYIHANILDAQIPVLNFDIIFAGAIIHLFPKSDAYKVLSKIRKCLKNNGILFINTTINNNSEEGYFVKSDYNNSVTRFRKKWTEGEFKTFVSAEFEILDVIYTDEKNRNKLWVGYICKPLRNYEI